ncbi:MAG TPA: alpha-amylase family glycosyl hydrolase, partial [Thermosynergistes sp.]|nr:alpha-amylase family glycosyl hydrolase [Thermosynergistes sp.]
MGGTLQEGWRAPEGSSCVMPSATYRLQLSPAFGFNCAKGVVAYLADLGISHIYASPIFKARKGSGHGYDVTDYGEINPELGTPQELDDLLSRAASKGLGWIQDIVPNHMAYSCENAMLMDVLENGSVSRYFRWFDAEWDHPNRALKGRILSPFLGRFYGDALEGCEISLVYGKSGFSVSYYDIVFPLRVESYTQILLPGIKKLTKKLGENNPDLIKLLGVLYAMKSLSSSSNDTDPDERHEQTRFIKEMLWELYSGNAEIKGYIDQKVSSFNGKVGDPSSFDALDDLLSHQFFRLAFWKVACEEINYRRFFNVNDLIAIRAHEEEVFERVHSLIFSLTGAGKVCGLRVDHVDGLYDPAAYLSKLREKAGDLYLVVEKILAPEERLPSSWPVHGTTGYDFLNRLNGIFCDARGEKTFDRIYASLCGLMAPYEELVFDKKRLIMGKEMAGDVDNVATLMIEAASGFRHGRDITS